MRNLAFILTLLCFYGQSSFSQNPIYYTAEETGTNSAGFNLLNTVGYWHISGPRSYENNNNLSVFWNDGSFKRYLTILDDGKIGIGTSSPTALLQVDGSTIFKPDVTNNNYLSVISNTSAQTNLLFYSNNTARWNLYSNNENFHFRKAGTNSSEVMLLDSQGNVGIGTTNPQEKLQIGDGFQFHDGGHKVIRFNPNSSSLGKIRFDVQNQKFVFEIDNNNNIMSLLDNGNIGIGTLNPSEKLTVNGKILCEEVEVIADVPPDYVFEKYYTGYSSIKADYVMPTLEEVEAFTKENYHLPEVPSAKEIVEEGLELKKMTTLLLQKVEELTLYTIEQEKRIKTLEAELAKKE